MVDDEKLGGFLKLTRTKEWVSGDNIAPVNRKMAAKVCISMFLLSSASILCFRLCCWLFNLSEIFTSLCFGEIIWCHFSIL